MARVTLHNRKKGYPRLAGALIAGAGALAGGGLLTGALAAVPLAGLLGCAGLWLGRSKERVVQLRPGHVGGHPLGPDEQVVLFSDGTQSFVKSHAGRAMYMLGDDLEEARRCAEEVASQLATTVVECIATSYHDACVAETRYIVELNARNGMRNFPDRDQIRSHPPDAVPPSLDVLTFELEHDTLTIDSQAVRSRWRQVRIDDLIDVHLYPCPPCEGGQSFALLLYTAAGWKQLGWEGVSSSLHSPERRRRLGELFWLVDQIRARIPADVSEAAVPEGLDRLRQRPS